MGIGVGILLLAVGAILTFGIEATVSGVDLGAVGIILMLIGVLGIALSLTVWGGDERLGPRRTTRVVRRGRVVQPQRVVRTVQPVVEDVVVAEERVVRDSDLL